MLHHVIPWWTHVAHTGATTTTYYSLSLVILTRVLKIVILKLWQEATPIKIIRNRELVKLWMDSSASFASDAIAETVRWILVRHHILTYW